MAKKTILVTGGCGFIFSNFIRYLLNKHPDYRIINLDALKYAGRLENTRDFQNNPRYLFVRGDICNKTIVERLVKEVDWIVHGAAESHVDRSILGPDEFFRTNVLGTRVLLEAAKNQGIKLFCQIGTDEEYGTIERGSFTEESLLEPNSPYSASKTAASLMARAYYKTFGLPVLIVRSSNNFGPFQFPEKLIPLFVTNLLEGRKVPVYGDGQQVRNWLYVLDNCAAIDHILHYGQVGQVYNIGGEAEKTNLEITKIILWQLGKDENHIEHVKDRLGHDRRYSLDSTKLKNLGWQPRYPFEEAIAKTIQWYVDNRDWWQPIKSGKYWDYYQKQYLQR